MNGTTGPAHTTPAPGKGKQHVAPPLVGMRGADALSPLALVRLAQAASNTAAGCEDAARTAVSVIDKERHKNRVDLLYDRNAALHELAALLPARTLGDATAHALLAFLTADYARAAELDQREMVAALEKIRRLMLSALPQMLTAAGVEIGEIADPWLLEMCEHAIPDGATAEGGG